jgi:hypothetical protein
MTTREGCNEWSQKEDPEASDNSASLITPRD